MPISTSIVRGAPLLVAGCAFFFTGCKERAITVYTVPKEREPVAKQEPGHEGHDHAPGEEHSEEAPLPAVKWTLPAAWTDLGPDAAAGGPVRAVGRFEVKGTDATVNITPLGSFSGKEPMLVNMWRSVFGLDPLTDEDATKALTDTPVAGGQGKYFDLTGDQRGKKTRIITAMYNYAGQSWFFKLQGSPESVEPQVAAFKQFIATIKFEAAPKKQEPAPAPEPAPAEAAPTSANAPTADAAPAGWTAVAPGAMQIAKYNVPEKDGAKAEVTVSVFPNDTGGNLANINRWRGQVGLPDTDEAGLKEFTTALDPAIPGSVLADLKGEQKHMLGAIVPRDGQYFFYKLTGDPAAVSAARESFVSFIRTAK